MDEEEVLGNMLGDMATAAKMKDLRSMNQILKNIVIEVNGGVEEDNEDSDYIIYKNKRINIIYPTVMPPYPSNTKYN